MIIIRVMGGLGNQMQQFALYKKLESMGKEVRLDTTWFRKQEIQTSVYIAREMELDFLEGTQGKEATPEEIKQVLGRMYEDGEDMLDKVQKVFFPSTYPCFVEKDMYHEKIFRFDKKYLVGYWACEKYYADVLEQLRKNIRFPKGYDEELNRRNDEMVQKIESCNAVSMHLRRGDYLDPVNKAMFGGICTDTYYDTAIHYIKERVPDAKFFLFSDDPEYAAEKYKGNEYEVVDLNHDKNSFYDMMLMSHCRHNICANSTFSFWGARLNGHENKLMIRPSIHKNTQVCIPAQMKDLWQNWVLIAPQGAVI